MIATDRGWRPVEALSRGDRIVTRDNGLKRVAWAGRRDLTYGELAEVPEIRPILIRKGALGDDLPDRDMMVSPNHRFLIESRRSTTKEVLVAARFLLDGPGIDRVPVLGVSYLHVLLDGHEVILANGQWTESFHPDDQTLLSLSGRTRSEILALFPEIETQGAARRFPAAREIRQSRFES
jgi:hypothetical protein